MEIQETLSLESKKNNHKVVITDIAISKVPFVEYRRHDAIKMIVAVTNLGNISYLVKTDKYDFYESKKLLRDAVKRDREATTLKQKLDACDYFMNNCYKTGLIFEDH